MNCLEQNEFINFAICVVSKLYIWLNDMIFSVDNGQHKKGNIEKSFRVANYRFYINSEATFD